MNEEKSSPHQGADLSGILGAILSNPEALSRVGKIISDHISADETSNASNPPPVANNTEDFDTNIPTNSSDNTNNENNNNTFQPLDLGDTLPKLLSLFSSSGGAPSQKTKEQIALLTAIKPYLSPRRKDLIDSFIKMSRFGAILKNFNGGQNVL